MDYKIGALDLAPDIAVMTSVVILPQKEQQCQQIKHCLMLQDDVHNNHMSLLKHCMLFF
jgi:hypothetical protein